MSAPARPVVISLLLGASGWFAGLFLLLFVGTVFQPDNPMEYLWYGAVLMAAAWVLFKVDADAQHVFFTQIALALSIAGQCLVLLGLGHDNREAATIIHAALALQIALALLMPNRLHRTLSMLFACVAWALTLHLALIGDLEGLRGGSLQLPPLAATAAWLAGWALPLAGLVALIRGEQAWTQSGWEPVLRPLTAGLLIGLMFATLASEPFESLRWTQNATQRGGLALWPVFSAVIALGALAAAFALRRRALMGFGVVAVLLHVAHFYYTLGTSLLVKSMLMLAMGCVLLLAARALKTKEA